MFANHRAKYVLLGSLYITQYLGIGFFFIALTAIMRQQGMPLEQIGIIYVLGLFWILKFLWAPLVDRIRWGRLGHYRGWLILMQSAMIVCLLGIALLDVGTQFWLIFGLAGIFTLFSATQDIAADALACNLLAPHERGVGNGIQMAGGLLGNVIGGGLVLIAYDIVGWVGAMLILALGTALPLGQILRFREPATINADHAGHAERVRFRDMVTLFRRRGMGRWLVLLLLFSMGINTAYGLITPLLVDAGWELARIGFATNIVGSLIGLAAAMGAGYVVKWLGRKPALMAFALLQAVALLALLAPALGQTSDLVVALAVGALFLGYSPAYTVLSTVMMDKARPSSPGTDYTTQYCVVAMVGFAMGGGGLALAGAFGYVPVILGAAAVALIVALLVQWLYVPDSVEEPVPLVASPAVEGAITQ